MTTNRMGWVVETNDGWDAKIDGAFCVYTLGARLVKDGFATEADAEAYIAAEVARRDKVNARSRGRHALMTGLGMVRNLNGSYE